MPGQQPLQIGASPSQEGKADHHAAGGEFHVVGRRPVWTLGQIAEAMQVSRRTLERIRSQGCGPWPPVTGTTTRFSDAVVQRWFEGRQGVRAGRAVHTTRVRRRTA